MTQSVGVRELKNGLSAYLRRAHDGESILVCDHGEPVAMLTPLPREGQVATTMAEHVAVLAARGLVTLPSRASRRRPTRPRPKVDLSSAVLEDRDDRA